MSSAIANAARRTAARTAARVGRRSMSTAPVGKNGVRQFSFMEIYGDKGAMPVVGAVCIALGLAGYFGSNHVFNKTAHHGDVYGKNNPRDTEFGVREVREFKN